MQISSKKIRTPHAYQKNEIVTEIQDWEDWLARLILDTPEKKFLYPGYCQVCKENVDFLIDNKWSGDDNTINFRERVVCPVCGLNNRMRAMMELIFEYIDVDRDNVYIYEQITPMYRILEKKIRHLVGSEFLDSGYEPGYITEQGIRHENAMDLSFSDENFKCIVSQAVFEHVAEIKTALLEAYRILQSGGVMLISVPFSFDKLISQKRAELCENAINYIKEPVYHGNLMSNEGSLVFYDYGWDLLEWIKCVGFKDVYFKELYSVKSGNIGINKLWFLIAEK